MVFVKSFAFPRGAFLKYYEHDVGLNYKSFKP